MSQDPRRAGEARETPVSSEAKSKSPPRFRIETLEQRIAPFHCGGFGYGGCRACERTGGQVCDVFGQ